MRDTMFTDNYARLRITVQIRITSGRMPDIEQCPVEMVERKGSGHPDTLCDRAAEELSIALEPVLPQHFGAILHHNTDKALLVAGRALATFGHGEVIDPMYLLLAGRATTEVDGVPIPVGRLAVRTHDGMAAADSSASSLARRPHYRLSHQTE